MISNTDFNKKNGLKKLKHIFSRYIVSPSPILLPAVDYLLLRPVPFSIWFRLRILRLWLTGTKMRHMRGIEQPGNEFIKDNVIPHNFEQVWEVARGRTERLMNVLRSIRSVDLAKSKVLVIGPRNEAELLMLSRYGVRIKNTTAIDLFSYSPLIEVMDMHNLEYQDSSFDIVYSSFVITYSDRIPLACSEALRVAKDGALIVVAFEHMHEGLGNKFGVNRLSGGLNDLYPYFNEHIQSILWREEHDLENSVVCSTVFRVKKH